MENLIRKTQPRLMAGRGLCPSDSWKSTLELVASLGGSTSNRRGSDGSHGGDKGAEGEAGQDMVELTAASAGGEVTEGKGSGLEPVGNGAWPVIATTLNTRPSTSSS